MFFPLYMHASFCINLTKVQRYILSHLTSYILCKKWWNFIESLISKAPWKYIKLQDYHHEQLQHINRMGIIEGPFTRKKDLKKKKSGKKREREKKRMRKSGELGLWQLSKNLNMWIEDLNSKVYLILSIVRIFSVVFWYPINPRQWC